MTCARDIFSGIGLNWASAHYEAPAGQLAGGPTFEAGVLFNLFYGGAPGNVGSDVSLWGTLDTAAKTGWNIGITAAGLIKASYGDGAAIVTVTFDPGGRLLRRWCMANIAVAGQAIALWINGALVDASVPGNDISPSGRACALGDAFDSSAPFTGGVIAGAFYDNGQNVDPFNIGSEVARSGQVGVGRFASNSWQMPFFNQDTGPAAIWQPTTGSVNLSLVGDSSLAFVNASSNAWL